MDWAARFPRSEPYQAALGAEKPMGPNVLWLTEALTERLDLRPGMRVLDLGCGKAFSSMFLAREFAVTVWAADLWIAPTANFERVRANALEDSVFPLKAEAHSLPFADEYFDAIVSMDAYHYFGTDNLFVSYIATFLRPGGQIGIVVPGLREEIAGELPGHLQPSWDADFWSFHSPAWWQRHWERNGRLHHVTADFLAGGAELWLEWLGGATAAGFPATSEESMLRADGGRWLGFSRVVGTRL
jgi:cyclopropane fatty-acyl-phospholipid synthase-like methyltransferase